MMKNITKEKEMIKEKSTESPSNNALKAILAYSCSTKVLELKYQKTLINLN